MVRKEHLYAAAALLLLTGAAVAQEEAVSFMAQLRQVANDASSAVPPLRMRERTVTAVFPGRFSGRRADAVLISNDNASLCRGPDYRRCLALGYLPTKRTVATIVKGESTLLVLDSMSSIRACSIDATNDRASLNCRAVDNNKLKDYNAETLAGGNLLVINGTDGNYACSQNGAAWPSCSQTRTTDKAQRKIEKRFGKTFKPLDQPDKTCRVKKGEILCHDPLKLSELDDDPVAPVMQPRMLPVLIYYDEDDPDEDWGDIAITGFIITTESGDAGAPMDPAWWSDDAGDGIAQPPRPPNYWQQQCLDICVQQDIDYGDLCRQTGLASLIFGPVIAGGYWLACEGGRGRYNQYCRHTICGI